MKAYPRPHEEYSTSYKYYVVFVLALVSTFNTVDRALIMVLAEPIKREFALSDTQLGLLAGLIFAVSYSLAGVPLGMMIDRYRRTRMLAGMLAVWSCLTAASGLAGSWITLALARMGVGAAESGANPASMSLITDYFPKEKRGFALSVFFASTPLGMMLSFAIGGALAAAYGWRAAFLLFGIPGILLATLLLATVREPRRGNYDDADAGESKRGYRLREALGTLLRIRPLLLLLLAAVCVVIAQAGLAAFLSSFLIRIHQLSIDEAGFAIAFAKGPTGIAGIIAGGILADRLARRSAWAGPRMIGFLVALATPFAIAALFADSWQVAIVLFAAYNFFNYTYYGATFATYMTLAPVHMRGVLAGILAVALTMIGYSMGPTIAGAASDLFAAAGMADPLRWALVVTASFFAVAGGLFLAAARSIRRREAVQQAEEDPVAVAAQDQNAPVFDYSRRIREGGLGARQALVLLMIGLLVLFDGMDNQLLALIAHDMGRDLDIPLSAFGVVFSAALVGAIAGALLISAAADQWLGRKRVVIIGMVLAGLGTLATAHAETLTQLIAVRFVTGIGLGGALPTLVSLASEFSPQRHSRLVVSVMIAFVPLGSLLGSVMARAVMAQSDWHMLLHVAGITTLTLTAAAALVVPESVHFLVSRKRDQRRALAAVRQLFPAADARAVAVDEDPAERAKGDRQPVARLFEEGLWKLTILFWIAFLMDQAILYFVMNWTPSLLLRSGMSSSAGIDAAAMFGLGGALGTIAQGWLTTRFGIYKVMAIEILLFVAAMLTLPAMLGNPQIAPALVFVIAATICAYHAGLINLILEAFPEAIKSTAFGWAFGIGRIGAAGAPVLVGLFLGWGWSPALIFLWAATLGMTTGAALLGVRLVLSRKGAAPAVEQGSALGPA